MALLNVQDNHLIDLHSQTLGSGLHRQTTRDATKSIMREVARTFWGFGIDQFSANMRVDSIFPAGFRGPELTALRQLVVEDRDYFKKLWD